MCGFNWIGLASMVIAVTSLLVSLRSFWFSSREANKKAVAVFLDYLRQAQDLAFDNYSGYEISDKKQKHFHLIGASDVARLEIIGRPKDVEKIILELYKKYVQLVDAGTSESKMHPDQQIKLVEEIRAECYSLIRNYTFKNYLRQMILNLQ